MKISAWGNSRAVRIPKSVADAVDFKVGTRVSIRTLDNGGLLILPLNGAIEVCEAQTLVKKTVRPAAEAW